MGMQPKLVILLVFSQFVLYWFLWTKMSMYYTQVGKICWFIIFDFQQLLLLAKIDQTHGEVDSKPPKS
jgi:hypothetical protein